MRYDEPFCKKYPPGSQVPEEGDAFMMHDSQVAPCKIAYDALVLDAGLRQSLATVRSLGSRGLRVGALETADALPAPAFSSRWCHSGATCPADSGTQEYFTYLERVLAATRARVLIPTADGTIALLREHRGRL